MVLLLYVKIFSVCACVTNTTKKLQKGLNNKCPMHVDYVF